MTRFEPTRAGIINMWDYRDEEFCFAGGWLVLRGPNGSGKTKALEVLFPFVLDGRIDPKRLNPFAAEDRTMKSNLLYRGGENAVGYAWLEFRHADTGEAVTVGIGLHAQRHRDTPVRWHFVADGRVGEDFSLITDDDRPMTRKQLAEEIGETALYGSPTEYRAAIDQRLFGLGAERYEQLLTLILTLRRPQLAKNLDPVKLSDTLTDGLRPVDDDLIAEAARSFDDMEAVALTLEGLAAADEATQTFLASYTTYLRTHARWAADAVTRRREATTAARQTVAADSEAQQAAGDTAQAAAARREAAENAVARLRARIEQLRASSAYQAVEQMQDLDRLVRTCLQSAAEASAELGRRQAAVTRGRDELGRAKSVLADMQAAVSRTAAELAGHAGEAGMGWQPADASPEGLAERAGAKLAVRLEAVRAVRAAIAWYHKAEQARDLARLALDRAQDALAGAEQAEQAAADAVQQALDDAERVLGDWAARHAGLVAAAEQGVRDEQAALRAARASASANRDRLAEERDRIAAERDDAPPAYPGRTADRAGREGAPLWRLVRFADHVPEDRAAAIEAALQATGMLDAVVLRGDDPPLADPPVWGAPRPPYPRGGDCPSPHSPPGTTASWSRARRRPGGAWRTCWSPRTTRPCPGTGSPRC